MGNDILFIIGIISASTRCPVSGTSDYDDMKKMVDAAPVSAIEAVIGGALPTKESGGHAEYVHELVVKRAQAIKAKGHTFHPLVAEWLDKKSECPVCGDTRPLELNDNGWQSCPGCGTV